MKKLCLAFFFVVFSCIPALSEDAKITITSMEPQPGKITPLLFGNFIEIAGDFVNSEFGLWSQELRNRGFDNYKNSNGIGMFWKKYSNVSSPDDTIQLIWGDGYNPRGNSYQKIKVKDTNALIGLYQEVYVYDTVPGDFYCYLRGNLQSGKAFVSLCDTATGKAYFSKEITGVGPDWKKFEVSTPPINESHKLRLMISLQGPGYLDIDETSFMPHNNVKGVRKEFFDIFKEWQPGIIRYPGGFFADSRIGHWDYGVGDIDKRSSPNHVWDDIYQRADFGTDEFMDFCKSVGAEPHLVVDFGEGTPEEAVNWVEYCNGPNTSKFGSLREKYGHKDPYNVKYWEIGNEQYSDYPEIAQKYIRFYDSLKSHYPDLLYFVSGSYWFGKDYLNRIFDLIGNRADFYSIHFATMAKLKEPSNCPDRQTYLSIMSSSGIVDRVIPDIADWLKQRNIYPGCRIAITEITIDYGIIVEGWIDTLQRNSSLEAGIWMASNMNAFIRHADALPIHEKTFGLNHLRTGFNSKGERVVYPSPIHSVIAFMRHHTGDYNLPVSVSCGNFSTDLFSEEYCNGLSSFYNIPLLDVTVTEKDSIIFLSVVNKHPDDSIKTQLDFPFKIPDFPVKKYELYDVDYLAANTADFPDNVKVRPGEFLITDNQYTFPPHSYTLFEIPLKERITEPVDPDTAVTELEVSPNPAKNYIQIRKPSYLTGKELSVCIFDFSGRLVLNSSIDKNNLSSYFDISGLSQGMYFVRISSADNTYMRKFIKLMD